MKKIIHFVIDDKFIRDSVKCFQMASLTEDTFYLVSLDENYSLKYENRFINIVSETEAIKMVTSGSYDALVLHSLYALPPHILRVVNPGIKVIWFGWGYDMYNNYFPYKPIIPCRIFKDKTARLHNSFDWKNARIKLTEPVKRIVYKEKYSVKVVQEALGRIDFFAGVFEEEYDLLKNSNKYIRAKKAIHNYIHPEEFDKKDINLIEHTEGNNILLGNSGGDTNNHIDVLSLLYNVTGGKLGDIKIICPLSYGGKKDYIDKVIKTGRNLFGDSFVPLTSFLPLDEYNSLVQSCSSVLMGHLRQAAVGNCLTSMWMGLKLFMYEDSMNYQHYSKEGLTIFSLDTDLSGECLKQRLPDNDILKNRSFIESHHSYRIWKDNLRKLISEI